MKLSCLYDIENPSHEQLVTHIASVKVESRLEPITHQLRIAAESAPGATRKAFVLAAVEAGYDKNTAGIQFTYSRKLSKEMDEI